MQRTRTCPTTRQIARASVREESVLFFTAKDLYLFWIQPAFRNIFERRAVTESAFQNFTVITNEVAMAIAGLVREPGFFYSSFSFGVGPDEAYNVAFFHKAFQRTDNRS